MTDFLIEAIKVIFFLALTAAFYLIFNWLRGLSSWATGVGKWIKHVHKAVNELDKRLKKLEGKK